MSAAVVLSLLSAGVAAGRTIKRIEIQSSWVGFHARDKAELVIRGENGKFTLDGRTIDAALVNAFAAALEEPVVPELDSKNLGLTLGHFSEGLASKLHGGKYGFMDRTGKMAIPEQFNQVKPFAEGMAAVLAGEHWVMSTRAATWQSSQSV